MKTTKMLRLIVLLTLVVTVIMPVSSVYAEKPAGTTPPTVDGLLDESYTYVTTFPLVLLPPGDVLAPADLYEAEGDEYCYWAIVVDRGFNDNVYADKNLDNDYLLLDGWKSKHSFNDLEVSDNVVFDISYTGGTYTMTLDYLYVDPSGDWFSGQTGMDFSAIQGTPPISQAATSLHWNLDNSNWGGGTWGDPLTHSPPYDYNETPGNYWEWHMIYEFSIPKSLMGETCGEVTETGSHNSPFKEDVYKDELAKLGDRVWYDDGSGTQDPGEDGVADVIVELYDYPDGNKIRTTQTGPAGYYIFNNLKPGNYYVQFVASSLPPPPVGYSEYVFTWQDVGTDDTVDSDPDDTPTSPTYGQTEWTTLDWGETDLTWDAGIEQGGPTVVTLSSFAAKSSAGGSANPLWLGLAGLTLAAGSLFWAKRRAS